MQFPVVNVIADIKSVTKDAHLVFEISSQNTLGSLPEMGLSLLQKQKLLENFEKNDIEKRKTITFSHIHADSQSIGFFFPGKDVLSDRCELFTSWKENTVFVPDGDEVEAYEALTLCSYRFEKYLSKKEIKNHSIVISKEKLWWIQEKTHLLEAIFWARDMINMPPQDANPEKLVQEILAHTWNHFDVEIFDKTKLEKLGCNLLLAVWAGSNFPPYMVILSPKNPPKGDKYGLIGKWVTFDAGGIQIKPDTAMLDMKCDMSWAAGMIGVARYLDALPELPANIIIAIGLTENMTGWSAFKPLDIYKAYNGTTVEIHHTDAEWRLVLADVMSYVEDTYNVDHLITMATLTGACVYALGHDIAGIMGDDEDVISTLLSTTSPYEKVWRLPLNEKLKKSLKADIADLKNVARSEKAGSSIGWAFLSYFQGKAKLTHLDIAWPAYRETQFWYMPKWGTGWWVKILSDFFLKNSEKWNNI